MKRRLRLRRSPWSAVALAGCRRRRPSPPTPCDPDASSAPSAPSRATARTATTRDADTTALAALEAQMSLPQDTLTAPDGTIYILDWNNHRLRTARRDGKLSWVAGRGELGGSLDDPANGDFNHPTNIIFDASGENIIIAAWHNSKVRDAVDSTPGRSSTPAATASAPTSATTARPISSSLDLPASASRFDPKGNLVIMDQANQVLRMVDAAGDIHLLAGHCVIDAPAPAGPGPCADGVEPDAVPRRPQRPLGQVHLRRPGRVLLQAVHARATAATKSRRREMRMAQPFGQSATPAGPHRRTTPTATSTSPTPRNHLIRMIDTDGIVHRVAGQPPQRRRRAARLRRRRRAGASTPCSTTRSTSRSPTTARSTSPTSTTTASGRSIPTGSSAPPSGQCGEKGYAGDGGPPERGAAQAAVRRRVGRRHA